MESSCGEMRHEGLSKYIDWMFDNQKKVYEKLGAAVAEIQDVECKAKVENLVIQNQLIVSGLNIVRAYM